MVHLRGGSTDVVVDLSTGVPTIVYLGTPLGGDFDAAAMTAALDPPLVAGELDGVAAMSMVPEHGSGFTGRPGLSGHRSGRAWSPRFTPHSHHASGTSVTAVAVDDAAGLRLTTTITVADAVVVTAEVTNTGSTDHQLDDLTVTVPLPRHAVECITFAGRWTRELQMRRGPWPAGGLLVENRTGRTSHQHPPVLYAGSAGFGEWHGDVWGLHLAWSGNHRLVADTTADGSRYVQAGELLHPGEIRLAPGDSYRTPELIVTFSDQGAVGASAGFHRHLRARPTHPTTPRPVLLNTWEAVYFDHDLATLQALADVAAGVGVERFVLDDGWFGGRRDDTSGLGDWWVSPAAHPDGLAPLIHHVRGLGMEFGIWVEPEMVNPDSDLYRAHPDWALVDPAYEPVLGRNQLVLDLANPDAHAHILGQLDSLLADHEIAYVKWDMNRDHVQASGAGGAAGTHAQTESLYRLLDELRRRHPTVEIESCASGGGRIDHEILRRTVRVWTSDCNDALERQSIQRGASMFIPPEVMGAHIGPTRSHTTGRVHTLAFRASTAFFGHLGIEWNLLELGDADRATLAGAIAAHKEHRALLHGGDVVRFDTDESAIAHGVYAVDLSEAIVSYCQCTTAPSLVPPQLRLPGLDPDRTYRVSVLDVAGSRTWWGMARRQPLWLRNGVTLTGRQLAAHGLQMPAMHPESVVLVRLVAAG